MKTLWTVQKGRLEPHDQTTVDFMRKAHLRVGDVVSCEITMPRSFAFQKAAHKLARLLMHNNDSFMRLCHEHKVIKKLQGESGIACDTFRVEQEGSKEVYLLSVPRTLKFDQMDELEFRAVMDLLIDYVAENYWPNFDYNLLDGDQDD